MHSRHRPTPLDTLPPVTLREYRPGDEEVILATFNRVFAEIDPNFVPRTLAYWRWQNLENPSGVRIRLAMAEDGRLAAYLGGVAQRARMRGEPSAFSQSVDGFAHPDWRRTLKKRGVYADTLMSYNHTYSGPPFREDVFVWGLPVLAAWRVGRAHCQQRIVRNQNKLVADLERVRLGAAGGVEVEEVERFPEEVDGLFATAHAPHEIIAVRDAPQLNWRFADHPEFRYRIALARSAGRLVGYAVYRAAVYDGDRDGLLCDWLVEPGHAGAAEALRAWALECARAEGLPRLTAVFPDTIDEWLQFQDAGFRVRPTSYFPGVYIFLRPGGMDGIRWLHRHWYYTLGDSDLC